MKTEDISSSDYDADKWAEDLAAPLNEWAAGGLAAGFTGKSVLGSVPLIMPSEAFRRAAELDAERSGEIPQEETLRRQTFVDEVCARLAKRQIECVQTYNRLAAKGKVADLVCAATAVGVLLGLVVSRGPVDPYVLAAFAGVAIHTATVQFLWRRSWKRASKAFPGAMDGMDMPWATGRRLPIECG